MRLMAINKTTIEMHFTKGSSIYSMGTKKNWESIFGVSLFDFLLPTHPKTHFNPHEFHNYITSKKLKSDSVNVMIENK